MPTLELEESQTLGDRPHGRKPSWITWIALVVVFAIAGFVAWRLYASRQETLSAAQKSVASSNRPVPVLVAEVQQRKMAIYLTALGTVTAYNTVTVRSRVDGQLVKVNFKEGQSVKRGALLLQIDPEPYAAAVELAQGQYAKDEAAVTMGKAEAARYQGLFDAGVVSQESQQTQESIYGQAQGALKADLAAIHAAKVNLAYTNIVSPIDGQVGLRQVDAGNIVHAADANGLVVVTQLQPISVIFTVPEDQLPLVRQKLLAKEPLKVEAFDRTMITKLATGTLLTVDNQIDATTGTDKLKAVFVNKDNALFPNQFVNIRLTLEERPNVLVIPASALQMGNAGNFIYVVKADNTVEARPIPDALAQGSLLVLDRGVKPGERVVIDGQEKIHAGSKIVVSKGGSGKGDSGDDIKSTPSGKGSKPSVNGDFAAAKGKTDGKGKGSHKASGESSGAAQ
jgi:membrane fusion protein, multidrug efflux system